MTCTVCVCVYIIPEKNAMDRVSQLLGEQKLLSKFWVHQRPTNMPLHHLCQTNC